MENRRASSSRVNTAGPGQCALIRQGGGEAPGQALVMWCKTNRVAKQPGTPFGHLSIFRTGLSEAAPPNLSDRSAWSVGWLDVTHDPVFRQDELAVWDMDQLRQPPDDVLFVVVQYPIGKGHAPKGLDQATLFVG
jgi:hypothetical protein